MREGSYLELENFYTTADYCHCNFSVLPSLDSNTYEVFSQMLLSQNNKLDNPIIAKMMQMEGLNRWIRVGERIKWL